MIRASIFSKNVTLCCLRSERELNFTNLAFILFQVYSGNGGQISLSLLFFPTWSTKCDLSQLKLFLLHVETPLHYALLQLVTIFMGNTTCIFRKRVFTKHAFLIVLNFPNLQPPLNYFELPLPSEEYSYISVLFKRVRNMIFDIHWSLYTKHFPCNFTHHYFNEWY